MQKRTLRPFGLRDKIGYLFGDFGNDFTFILSTSILMKFYTDVMGLSSGLVGLVMMLARFLDAVTDVTMGRIADRSRPTAAGKFKPWLLRLCVPVAAASFLMYQHGFAGMSYGFRVVYFTITYLLWGSFCYTGINIPYGSMASAISADPGDRQSLSTYRTMGGTLAGLVIGVGLPMFAYDKVPLADGTVRETLNGARVTAIAGLFSGDRAGPVCPPGEGKNFCRPDAPQCPSQPGAGLHYRRIHLDAAGPADDAEHGGLSVPGLL